MKRNVVNISPETPGSKRFQHVEGGKISDMRIEDFKELLERMVEPLATSADIENLHQKINELQNVNEALTSKVNVLTIKCAELENQMQSVYLWRNSGNMIVKLNRSKNNLDQDKERVFRTCVQLSDEPNIVEKAAIREVKNADKRKITFKVITGDSEKVVRMLKNSALLRGTDISVTKDYPRQIREQQQNLLKVRRFIMKSSNAKPKVRGSILFDGEVKLTWSSVDGLVSSTDESVCDVLRRYGQTVANLEQFLAEQNNSSSQAQGGGRIRSKQSGMA